MNYTFEAISGSLHNIILRKQIFLFYVWCSPRNWGTS